MTASISMLRPHPRRANPAGLIRLCLVAAILGLVGLTAAGRAAPATEATGFDPTLRLSVYQPTVTRDPFLPARAAATKSVASADQSEFQLQGLLWDNTNPAVIVNNEMLVLNRPKKVLTSRGQVEVTAVEITRQRVVLEAGGTKIELPLEAAGQ